VSRLALLDLFFFFLFLKFKRFTMCTILDLFLLPFTVDLVQLYHNIITDCTVDIVLISVT
jgi:hypothetical protein